MMKFTPLALLALATLTACGSAATPAGTPDGPTSPATTPADGPSTPAARETLEAAGHSPRLAVTYSTDETHGGVQVIDAAKGTVVGDFPLQGFTRLSQAGDDRHLLVTEGDHFRLLDLGTWSKKHGDHFHAWRTSPLLTDVTFEGKHPGHAVVHEGRTALFYDGEGRIETFEPSALALEKPKTSEVRLPKAHHGVAILREDDAMVHTVGDEEHRTGIAITGKDGKMLAQNAKCPGVHGEAEVQGALTFGCEDGMLVVKGNTITKVQAPVAYARIGNQAGSEKSPIAFGDWKVDKKAELERPTKVSLVDTRTGKLRLVETGASYSFRSLGRDEAGNALLLGTDGNLRLIDVEKGAIVKKVPVVKPWTESTTWQDPRPTLFVNGGDVWVSEPATKQLHLVDVAGGKVARTVQLTQVPNELNGVRG